MDGVLLRAKPAGVTSHDVVAEVRRALPRKTKVGHAGTLDPFATGLLLVLVGRATRAQRFLMELPKTYRAVARPGACFATELTIDALARAVKREAYLVRRENLVPAEAMPYRSVTGKLYDSGDYRQSLDIALDAIDLAQLRAEQKERLADGRPLLGVGFATYTEHTGVSTSTLAGLGTRLMPGHELAAVRIAPDGGTSGKGIER